MWKAAGSRGNIARATGLRVAFMFFSLLAHSPGGRTLAPMTCLEFWVSNSFRRGMMKMGTSGLGMARPNEPLPTDDEFDVYRKRMMLAYKYRPNPMVSGEHNKIFLTSATCMPFCGELSLIWQIYIYTPWSWPPLFSEQPKASLLKPTIYSLILTLYSFRTTRGEHTTNQQGTFDRDYIYWYH